MIDKYLDQLQEGMFSNVINSLAKRRLQRMIKMTEDRLRDVAKSIPEEKETVKIWKRDRSKACINVEPHLVKDCLEYHDDMTKVWEEGLKESQEELIELQKKLREYKKMLEELK